MAKTLSTASPPRQVALQVAKEAAAISQASAPMEVKNAETWNNDRDDAPSINFSQVEIPRGKRGRKRLLNPDEEIMLKRLVVEYHNDFEVIAVYMGKFTAKYLQSYALNMRQREKKVLHTIKQRTEPSDGTIGAETIQSIIKKAKQPITPKYQNYSELETTMKINISLCGQLITSVIEDLEIYYNSLKKSLDRIHKSIISTE